MFCPSCKDEFREGFTHCGRCEVDLVDRLDAVEEKEDEARSRADEVATTIPMVDYCGFFDLDEARSARDRLRAVAVHCEIVIREHPGAALTEPAVEEYWLRVELARYRQVQALLQEDEPADSGTSERDGSCPACGADVSGESTACPDCGISLGA